MLGSKNDFFFQDYDLLITQRNDLIILLGFLDRSDEDVKEYLKAFDFFIGNPFKFDGATVVRDLFSLKYGRYKLDIDAMLHDYRYVLGANSDFKKKHDADLEYFNNMLLNGKGAQVTRLLLLIISGIFFVPYTKLKNL